MKKKLKVLVLFHSPYFKPRGYDFKEEFADPENMYTEKNVVQALKSLGHEATVLGLYNDVSILIDEIKENRPDIVFNMVEVFNDQSHLEKNVAALLEILDIPYTGASTGSLFICNNKALCKTILVFHRIKVPRFYTFIRKRKIFMPTKLKLPAIVKPLCEEASRGISQASIVDNQDSLFERVKFIHDNMNLDAIVEEYIDGRELYVSVIGHKRVVVLPPRELKFGNVPEGEPRIATYKAKWDDHYRERWGIKSVAPGKLPEGWERAIKDVCKRAYQALDMDSYTRFDIRVTEQGEVYIIEPNANPCIARIDELALSAEKEGINYADLISMILELGFRRYEKNK
ncbi:MAG: ATP-grasp domain-containing protein [Candidatus Omnitrophica bacterium]|nr:ATP-grasp domain-containing protein [Candidatus Omnitrophota bacterium]